MNNHNFIIVDTQKGINKRFDNYQFPIKITMRRGDYIDFNKTPRNGGLKVRHKEFRNLLEELAYVYEIIRIIHDMDGQTTLRLSPVES